MGFRVEGHQDGALLDGEAMRACSWGALVGEKAREAHLSVRHRPPEQR
jgi:hypothetical protein